MRSNACSALILLLAVPFLLLLATPPPTRTSLSHPQAAIDLGWEGIVAGPNGPLAGALVRIQTTGVCTRTDAAGRFRLPRGRGPTRVTAWQPGHFIGGVNAGTGPLSILLQPLEAEDDEAYAWVDPAPDPTRTGNCANCHAALFREWSGSAHARSATGRHLRDLYEGTDAQGRANVGWGLLTEHPDGSGVCTACHAPSVADADGARLDLRRVTGVAAQGVHCDYCHKIARVSKRSPGLNHGSFDQELLRPADPDRQIFFGPLDDVDRGEDAYSPLYRDSRYCASCHEGIVFGVHVYSTYSEWQASRAAAEGKQCQDCHMKPTGRMTNVAPGHGGKERPPSTLANHRFFDGSHEDMLRRCVQVSTTVVSEPGMVRARVRLIAEGAGHRVPTGFIDRHLLLVLDGLDGSGAALPAVAGPRLPAGAGDLEGRAGKLYGRLLTDYAGRAPAPFWRPVREPEDTRLTVGQPDEAVVDFPPGVRQVRVRLLYRRFWQETVRAKGWPDRDLVLSDAVSRP